MTMMDGVYLGLFERYAQATFTTGFLRVILPSGRELLYGDQKAAAVVAVPGAKGEEWRRRPAPAATLRVFSFDFFRKVRRFGRPPAHPPARPPAHHVLWCTEYYET